MKKGKQKPIFSKLQDILREQSPAPLPDEPFKLDETLPGPESGVSKELFPGSEVVPDGDDFSPQPDVEEINKEATGVEAVSPKVIRPPEGIEAAVNSLGMAFVLIPAGTFVMGSPDYEPGRNEDELPHEVTLSRSFYLQTTPVTRGQWLAVMRRNPAGSVTAGADLPSAGLNWQDCQLFIKKLNEMGEGSYRLPTEAEWEYACRAGSETALSNGDIISLYCESDPNLEKIAWYCGNSHRKLHPVGQKDPNAWGLYDMHGNISEWCQDWYGPYPETPLTDPTGPSSGPGRIIRGGSWFSSAKNCRSAARFHWPPQSGDQLQVLGFRLVKLSS